ncbi:related to Type I protein geranylgeranyltransferase beta subunit [Melanopsichium pennsylvanicum]|uniref:Related to Type I protein geranylgeranyltransferase beta subunit n=1 Tax=Melanopsichium pennsylvanicum TaxID=63383 RepID=A0AAJ4XKH7_9BASI|nr:related to Type I protein geranylgeranyltransferase beta subunit [Melanopsichium pennsylvanicum]
MVSSTEALAASLEVKKHISFNLRCLRMLPQPYTSADDQRMTLGYFALSSLDLLYGLDKIPTEEKQELVDWIYDQQSPSGGFGGSPSNSFHASCCSAGASRHSTEVGSASIKQKKRGMVGNVAMTYAALVSLSILRDSFQRLNRSALIEFISALQDKTNGGFAAEIPKKPYQSQLVDRDPRFSYCAIAICSMLGEWGEVDIGKAKIYVQGCQRYDGGFGASEWHESHSGMGYCCVAALHLLGVSSGGSKEWKRREEAITWLAHRQVGSSQSPPLSQHGSSTEGSKNGEITEGRDREEEEQEEEEEEKMTGGFQGRPNKLPPDVCYSFWNGGALAILGEHDLVDAKLDAGYVLSAQSKVGGISKMPDEHPDLLHTYLGLASLSLHQPDGEGQGIEFGMKRLDAVLNCSLEAKRWILKHLTKS